MKNLIESANLAVLLVLVVASCGATRSLENSNLRVSGRVQLKSVPAAPKTWELDKELKALTGETHYVDESILVSEDLGLANCVVSLHRVGDTSEIPPIENALYEKVGPRYVPRVLVVTTGTEVLFRNRNSPCNGFMARAFTVQFNRTVSIGQEFSQLFARPEAVPIGCDLRPYMRGAVVAVDTNWFAVTDSEGHWEVAGLAPGDYEFRVWHERMGRRSGKRVAKWTVSPGEHLTFDYELDLP